MGNSGSPAKEVTPTPSSHSCASHWFYFQIHPGPTTSLYLCPLTFTHTPLSSTPSSLMPNPPASGPLGQLFPWTFPEMGPLPPPHQKVPSPRPSSYSCLTITLIFFIACMKKMLIYSCLPPKNGAQGLGLRLLSPLHPQHLHGSLTQAWGMMPCCPYCERRCHSCASEKQDSLVPTSRERAQSWVTPPYPARFFIRKRLSTSQGALLRFKGKMKSESF